DADDILGAAIISLEGNHATAGKVALELEDVCQVCPAPSVNRLIGIAGDAKIGMLSRERANDRVLGEVGVLILIDRYVFEATVEFGAHVFVFLEDRHYVDQQIVKIDRRSHLEPGLVEFIDLSQPSSLQVGSALPEGCRANQVVLGSTDEGIDAL